MAAIIPTLESNIIVKIIGAMATGITKALATSKYINTKLAMQTNPIVRNTNKNKPL